MVEQQANNLDMPEWPVNKIGHREIVEWPVNNLDITEWPVNNLVERLVNDLNVVEGPFAQSIFWRMQISIRSWLII